MVLGGAKDQRLLLLVDLVHEDPDPLLFSFLDLNDLVKVRFGVALAVFNCTFHHPVVRRVDIIIECRRDLLHLKRREEAVVDPILQRIDIDRLAEIGIGVHVVFALGRGGQPKLYGGGEVFKDVAPVALVVCAAAMTLVNDDEVEKVRWIPAEIGCLSWATHKGLEDGEEETPVLRYLALLPNIVRLDPHQRIFRKGGKGIVGLICQYVPIGQKQNSRTARRLATQVPTAVKEFPGNLKGDEGLTRAGGEGEQDARLALRYSLHHPLDCKVLIVAAGMRPTLIFERHSGKAVAPLVW